ncbi:putative RING-H2 finger protein ATL53 [Andrographis paniculata]|uniref:putative RING-H2 finger protein ATL53 n=1 Tax=Andrographis paniculata TaxID=175694 RepID=UPI0021E778E7|nr:putative RING-H2 finger protein ATL53 [Andrographis paniculata]
MLQIVPKSSVLCYVVLITVQLKLVWDYLLYRPFFHGADGLLLPEYVESLNIITGGDSDCDDDCSVCLCKIDESDEMRELPCSHVFHRVCLDRWLRCGHATCPLCRSNLRLPPPQFAAEIHQEVILINFCNATARYGQWLR